MLRTAPSRPAAPVAAGLVLALALTGCGVATSPTRARAAEPIPSSSGTATAATVATAAATAAPTPTSSPTPRPTAPATASPAASPTASLTAVPTSTPTRRAVDVAAVQRRLTALRYYAGPVDGRSGAATRSAVMAFQKVNGLTADGSVGPRTQAALAAPRAPRLRRARPADRVEVDLDRQVLYVVAKGELVRVLPVSSGNGATYRSPDGSRARALTPVGTFRIERRIVGTRRAPLGTLHDPQYFHQGWAIHGSDSVPAVPASHGCVRVTRADAKALLRLIGVGTTVHLYGGRHVFTPGSGAAGTRAPAV